MSIPGPDSNPPGAQVVNCWNSIGVWGQERPRCPLLPEVIHCRNCEKYIVAGQHALQRQVPGDYQQEWTQLLARKKDLDIGHDLTTIVFRVGDEWFSLPVDYLQHVETRRAIHSIPHRKSAIVKGIVNVGGEIKMCFSLGGLLGVELASMLDSSQRTAVYEGLVVLKKGKHSYVFPVTEVLELARIKLDDLKTVPATVSATAASYLLGIFRYEGHHVGHLDTDLVMAGFERSL